ncbi:MAG: photolyase PhrII [Myxococcota bacterium]
MTLPEHLDERTTRLGALRADGEHVVYWMRTAVRGHENPALDVAIAVSNATGRPLLVYHAVSERYPFASDRHHTFLLEGARDVAEELAGRGIAYALHVERDGHRGPHLRALADRAALVVTEDMPVAPLAGWTRALAACAPVWLVDTACVVPMPLVGRAYDRAYAFQRATAPLRAGRVERPWIDLAPQVEPSAVRLPFTPVDMATLDIPALVAACAIDHSVGPVPHTRGGSAAGYARWAAFKQRGLGSYSARRNNAADPYGVSRMSAYLHMGFVSPLRLAREVASTGGAGAAKYLDELLVWREVAYAFCRFAPAHDTVAALPGWARATLALHATDPRPALPDWETLARGRTGDPLWDAAQRSLRVHGELHNNVRMTWGKALVQWTPDAGTALRQLIDLNHRYALDGRDPASYGGLLWCLGGFDRPFSPAQPILGEVRPRPTEAHARRLDLGAYRAHVGRPLRKDPPRTLVIGAGISGAACARALTEHGYPVVVVDKARGPGGRMATRRSESGPFDHGAQYVTARDPAFHHRMEAWAAQGVVAPWPARFVTVDGGEVVPNAPDTPRWVGTPSMSAVVKHLLTEVDVRTGVRVAQLWHDAGWHVRAEAAELGPFDAVVVSVPAPQAVALLDAAPELRAVAARVGVAPCHAVMVTLDAPAPVGWDAAKVRGDGPLAWVARDSSKPGRPPGERWVLHASPSWSTGHLEDPAEDVAAALVAAFRALTGAPAPRSAVAHRWRYAQVTEPAALGWDPRGLVLCGDGVGGGKVEAAWRSGVAAAGRLMGAFGAAAPDTWGA